MEKRKLNRITVGFIVLVVMVLISDVQQQSAPLLPYHAAGGGELPRTGQRIPMPPAVTP